MQLSFHFPTPLQTSRWGWLSQRPRLSSEALTALLCAYFVLFCNAGFWHGALSGRPFWAWQSWLFTLAVGLALTGLHFALLAPWVNRWSAKPLLATAVLASAAASYFTQRYQVYFDTSMLRNLLKTDAREASELFNWGLLAHLLAYGALPWLLLWRVQLHPAPLLRATLRRLAWVLAALLLSAGAILLVFQDFSALMRNHKALRHLITPGNLIVSTLRVAAAESTLPSGPKLPVGADAHLGASWRSRSKPAVLVVVVGETARAANWGLNGYARPTTPELAKLPVINFPAVSACGTNTEVSLPCMFSPYGRHDYDERAIRQHESLLHVLQHAKLGVLWRDNQSGCKGVCSDLPLEQLHAAKDPALCEGEHCLDEILIKDLDARIAASPGSLVIVLHQLGNHGPAYYRRYPASQRVFTPTCDTAELRDCTREQIVNSYDNALRYTDHLLAQTIKLLGAQTSHDAALIYVSDHGESLGENGVFLHGLPRAIAPTQQTQVPMLMWLSPGYQQSFALRADCLARQAHKPISHDYLFHTVLGMLDVQSSVYARDYDLSADCRG